MTKGIEQGSYATYADRDGQPVQLFGQMVAGRTFSDSFSTVLVGKDQSNTAFGFRGVAGSDDLPAFQAGASVISVMKSSGDKSVSSWGSPSGELRFIDLNGERVFGHEVIGSQPTNFDGSEWVMNFDSSGCENNLWIDYEYPEQSNSSDAVYKSDGCFLDHSSEIKGSTCGTADNNDQSKVGPVSSGAINIFVGHVCQTTTVITKDSKVSVTKEGI